MKIRRRLRLKRSLVNRFSKFEVSLIAVKLRHFMGCKKLRMKVKFPKSEIVLSVWHLKSAHCYGIGMYV